MEKLKFHEKRHFKGHLSKITAREFPQNGTKNVKNCEEGQEFRLDKKCDTFLAQKAAIRHIFTEKQKTSILFE